MKDYLNLMWRRWKQEELITVLKPEKRCFQAIFCTYQIFLLPNIHRRSHTCLQTSSFMRKQIISWSVSQLSILALVSLRMSILADFVNVVVVKISQVPGRYVCSQVQDSKAEPRKRSPNSFPARSEQRDRDSPRSKIFLELNKWHTSQFYGFYFVDDMPPQKYGENLSIE